MVQPLRWMILATALAAGVIGCEKQEARTALSYTADAKRAYDEAMLEFNSHNWIESQALFREVKRKYHYSKYAKLAKCSNDTALRDIRELIERGIIVKNPGGGRSTSYRLAEPEGVPTGR